MLLDTCALIWSAENVSISREASAEIAKSAAAAKLYRSPVSAWEVGMAVRKKRLELQMPVESWVNRVFSHPGVQIAPLTPEIAIRSCFLAGDFHADPVDRATAYRYFPTKEALLVELSDMVPDAAHVDALLANPAADDIEERLLLLIDTFDGIVLAEEEHFRTFTRVAMDTWLRSHRNGDDAPVVREGRRMRWLETVLAPSELPRANGDRACKMRHQLNANYHVYTSRNRFLNKF